MKRFLFLFLSLIFSAFIILLYPVARTVKPFLPFVDYLLGVGKPTSYIFLLGNDTEMRANGGFAGSYAKIILSTDTSDIRDLKSDIQVYFQDIYVPNGQLTGHVTPPGPIQQAFKHGTWELANADWEPDFPTAATTLRWFFEKGKEVNPDVIGIINLTTIKRISNIVGTFTVPEYKAEITPDNLYLFLQGKTEVGFFPGSTQKKDTLTAIGRAIIKKIYSLSLRQKLNIAYILYTDLTDQNIVVHSSNLPFQTLLEQKKLAGVFTSNTFDTYSLIETNLGANKANAYVTRSTDHQIVSDGSTIHHTAKVTFRNSSPDANPNPPIQYGGNYVAYLRFYLPATASNILVERVDAATGAVGFPFPVTPEPVISPKFGLTEVGFFHTTAHSNESTVTLTYDLIPGSPQGYTLTILKQHGFINSPQTLNVFSKTYSTDLKSTYNLAFPAR